MTISQKNARLISLIHDRGHIIKKDYRGEKVYLEVQLPVAFYDKIKKEI